jgi:ABC-type multidrug transport system ATPase subunit
VDGRTIKTRDLEASRLTAVGVGKAFGQKTVLRDISLSVYPREFVGLMGPSGCGKSTLMNALNGMNPASFGRVFINELDLYENFNALRLSIGFVPQRDQLHESLTVERTLFYAAKLRLPAGTSNEQCRSVIDEVITSVGLDDQRQNAFRELSGGQQKRLSLAIELITKPTFLFLDEPTSPLDPESTENMMLLFRRLADEGRIVVMVTHKFEKFDAMHQIAMLTKGGNLAFYGPPQAALRYFDCTEPADIYHRMAERDPAAWSREFVESDYYAREVRPRISDSQSLIQTSSGDMSAPRSGAAERKLGIGQFVTLTRRYLEIKLNDKRNTILLLAQAPLIAFILTLITKAETNQGTTLFIAAIIAIWFGANNAVREIVAEMPIYFRERLVNLKIPSYVLSKFVVLAGIGLIQCVTFAGMLTILGRFEWTDFVGVSMVLFLTLLAGISIGLFFSALVNSTEKAMSILPLILIPQLLLSGFLKPVDDIYVNRKSNKPVTIAAYERYQQEKDKKPEIDLRTGKLKSEIPDFIDKVSGLGSASPATALIIARWTLDGLAHFVSVDNEKARDSLASTFTVAGYDRVLTGSSESEVRSAYKRRVVLDLGILTMFTLVFLVLTILVLKRKDTL